MKELQAVLIFFLHLIKLDLVVADSYHKNPNGKSSLVNNQDPSSNEIPHDEIKLKYDDLHHYYLPMQTTFGSSLDPSIYGASITSPPHITPSSVYKSYDQTSSVAQDPLMNDDSVTPYLSQCISETPSSENLESEAILSSKHFILENHVLSGHTEIVSKTSSEEDISQISKIESQSSFPFERTHNYISSVTADL